MRYNCCDYCNNTVDDKEDIIQCVKCYCNICLECATLDDFDGYLCPVCKGLSIYNKGE